MDSDIVAKEDLTITKKKKAPISQSFTCPNPSCGRIFADPIKAENLSSKNAEPYDACPYCLTEITIEKDTTFSEEKQKLEVKKIESKQAREPSMEKKQGCPHYFGYLSKRSKKEKIPEECIVCEKIVPCMLKNVTG